MPAVVHRELGDARSVDAVDNTFSVTLDMYGQGYAHKASVWLSPQKAQLKSIAVIREVSSLRKRSISNYLT